MSPRISRRRLLTTSAVAAGAALTSRFTGILEASGSGQAAGQTPGLKPGPTFARERLLADFNWKFSLGHANDPAKDFGWGRGSAFAKSGSLIPGGRNGVTSATFDDSKWKPVQLPHDWAIDLPFNDNRDLNEHGAYPLGRTYPETSIGWYRRTFDIPQADLGRRITLHFDGVFRDAMVILNGHFIGRNLSGYTPFSFDVTDLISYGAKNALVVRVDATEYEGWFYEGAGIYRHVWLEKTAPLHVAHNSAIVTTTTNADGSAQVKVQCDVVNEGDTEAFDTLMIEIADDSGKAIARMPIGAPVSLKPWARQTFTQTISVPNAKLWSPDTPHLYMAQIRLSKSDALNQTFGIRTLHWDADKGFFLNGIRTELKGTCNHQDHAGVGAALPDSIQNFRIKKLKDMGCNAYRTSHNPPTPELLDTCDRLGMLVMDETRMMSSTDEGLSQLERLILRDRNHPSVFIWSIGNEEPEQGTDKGARQAATMKRLARKLDPTRLVTQAMNNAWGQGLSSVVDVQGFNYRYQGIDDGARQLLGDQAELLADLLRAQAVRVLRDERDDRVEDRAEVRLRAATQATSLADARARAGGRRLGRGRAAAANARAGGGTAEAGDLLERGASDCGDDAVGERGGELLDGVAEVRHDSPSLLGRWPMLARVSRSSRALGRSRSTSLLKTQLTNSWGFGSRSIPSWRSGQSVSIFLESVPKEGLEPSRPRGRRILNPLRLPFRHFGRVRRPNTPGDGRSRRRALNPYRISASRATTRASP